MKNKKLFEKTLAILVKAYQNDTLQHGFCSACAVGNIVAACNDYTVQLYSNFYGKNGINKLVKWDSVFCTRKGEQYVYPEAYYGEAKNEIKSTGYSLRELAMVEKSFEKAPRGDSSDDWMFNGLLAVYDVLCEIHEVSKEEVQDAKLIFVK